MRLHTKKNISKLYCYLKVLVAPFASDTFEKWSSLFLHTSMPHWSCTVPLKVGIETKTSTLPFPTGSRGWFHSSVMTVKTCVFWWTRSQLMGHVLVRNPTIGGKGWLFNRKRWLYPFQGQQHWCLLVYHHWWIHQWLFARILRRSKMICMELLLFLNARYWYKHPIFVISLPAVWEQLRRN